MNPIRWVLRRARAWFGRRGLEREMKAELRMHLDQATERMMARGMSRKEAVAAAQREFGNVALIEENARDARGGRFIESLIGDVRFAFRYFARKPLTTITIVVVLALGIGVNTALFSVIQAFTMRPAAGVPKNDRLARIWGVEQPAKGEKTLRGYSYAELEALAERKVTFTSVAGWLGEEVILQPREGHAARAVQAEFVTPNYWSTLGVSVVAGTAFAAADEATPDFAAIIGFALAEDIFADPVSALGKQMIINEIAVRVVGVAPPAFEGALPDNGRPQLWLPLSARSAIARAPDTWLDESRFSVFAKVAPGVTFDQATSVARDVVARAVPDSVLRTGVLRSAEVRSLRMPAPFDNNDEVFGFVALGIVALLILMVACTNVSSLLVAAAVGRKHEIAVRLSLGASRARVLRQMLTESTILAVSGGLAGLMICWWITTAVSKKIPVDIVPDAATLMFTMAFALGTGLLFGLSPALHATRAGVATALRESGSGATHTSRLQRMFVIAQIVFSQPLLVLIALVLSVALQHGLPKVNPVMNRVVSAYFNPLTNTGAPGQRKEALDTLARQIALLPGVETVVPEASGFAFTKLPVPSRPGELGVASATTIDVRLEGTAPGYFALLDVPIVLGRDVSLLDSASSEYPVVIGSDLARTMWGSENPIGRTLAQKGWHASAADSAPLTVVGVFDATKATTRGMGVRVYTARGMHWRRDVMLIRTTGDARAFVPTLYTFLRAAAPSLPVTNVRTLNDAINADRREAFGVAAGAVVSGIVALLLASIGLFAVVSLAVAQRKREIGIRIALGAEPLRVARMFFASGLTMSVIGLLIGLPITVIALRIALLRGVVMGPNFNLPLTGFAIAAVMLAVASAATWFPARKAATVEPSLALRAE